MGIEASAPSIVPLTHWVGGGQRLGSPLLPSEEETPISIVSPLAPPEGTGRGELGYLLQSCEGGSSLYSPLGLCWLVGVFSVAFNWIRADMSISFLSQYVALFLVLCLEKAGFLVAFLPTPHPPHPASLSASSAPSLEYMKQKENPGSS